MQVNYGGFVDFSTVDYFGKVSATIFLRGCNVKCPRCHNKELQSGNNYVNIEEIYAIIDNVNIKYIDAIIISGGEPLNQLEATIKIAKYIKSRGFKAGLHTSGEGELYKCIEYFDYILLNTNRN